MICFANDHDMGDKFCLGAKLYPRLVQALQDNQIRFLVLSISQGPTVPV